MSTPMLKQYQSIKARHQDCILFFRLGDFYEMFYEDAKVASGILDLVLTSRGGTKSGKVPMCGLPYHAADNYIARLIKAGKKIAICEQVEDPATAKGIVKRDVIRVITAGTFIDEHTSLARSIVALSLNKTSIGIAFTDTASGCIYTNQYATPYQAIETIAKLPVYECVYPLESTAEIKKLLNHSLLAAKNITLTPHDDWCFNTEIAEKSLHEHFGTKDLKGFGIDQKPQAIASAGALLEYLKTMHKQPLEHVKKITLYHDTDYVFISPSSLYGLELETLFTHLDQTLTPMGKRLLRQWVYHPLKNTEKITRRQEAISALLHASATHEAIQQLLKHTPDMDKAIARISCGYAHARDFLTLRTGCAKIPLMIKAIGEVLSGHKLFALRDIPAIRTLLEAAINPEIPLSNPEGKIIRTGYNTELDELRGLQSHGRQWLKKFQASEVQRTGINSLKIGFNKVFGYYIEITKSNLALIPQDYIRKQTLVNAERFITPELKEFEEKMLSADEKVLTLETRLLGELQKTLLAQADALHTASDHIALLDVLTSLTTIARARNYCCPEITADTALIIEEGRHPVVEEVITEPFVPNDTLLDCETQHLLIITGPNMAGKSTYIRQVALLVIMAQMGSFIPAKRATIGLVDKIFTRIGAHDDITRGRSTFMVEMSEAAEILNNLTLRSLVILDEIGRGTSTFDGLSLAWAIAEYIKTHKSRTLFATHFHELTALAEEYPGVKNYNVAVKEWEDEVIFLHKIIPGSTDDSYGIYVAKLAGIPQEVVQRSKKILTQLELYGNLKEKIRNQPPKEFQLSLFSQTGDTIMKDIKDQLEYLDLDTLTPLEALKKLSEWKKKIT